MNATAIQTNYKGYLFRSRLEARWAVFFDAVGIQWQYEHEGLENNGVKYLADFMIHGLGWHHLVEVKGSDDLLAADAQKLNGFLRPWPIGDEDGLLLLGEIPEPTRDGVWCHRIIVKCGCCAEPSSSWLFFRPGSSVVFKYNPIWEPLGIDNLPLMTVKPVLVKCQLTWEGVAKSYKSARSTRFEHGQNGSI